MLALLVALSLVNGARSDVGIDVDGPFEFGAKLTGGREFLPLPFELNDQPEEQLLTHLTGEHERQYPDAAGNLILRGPHAVAALDELLARLYSGHAQIEKPRVRSELNRAFEVWSWANGFAGDALGRCLATRLANASEDREREFLLTTLAKIQSEDALETIEPLSELARRPDELGDFALEQLARVGEVELPGSTAPYSDAWYHASYVLQRPFPAGFEEHLAKVLAHRLAVDARPWSPTLLEYVHTAGVASELIRRACLPQLEREFERTDSRDSNLLCILGHLDSTNASVREAYVDAWTRFDPEDMKFLPCRRTHDDATLLTFTRAFERTASKPKFLDRLLFMGETDARTSELTRAALSEGDLYDPFLRQDGFRGLLPVQDDDAAITKVHKLGITIATLQDDGRDSAAKERELAEVLNSEAVPSWGGGASDVHWWGLVHALELGLDSPKMVDAAIKVLEARGLFGRSANCAYELLIEADLSPKQRAFVQTFHDDREGFYHWTRGAKHLPRPRFAPFVFEYLKSLRRGLHSGDETMLGRILAEVPLAKRDEPYLLTMLARSCAFVRTWVLELIEHHGLDTPRIRTLVRIRTQDADTGVRELAMRLVEARAW